MPRRVTEAQPLGGENFGRRVSAKPLIAAIVCVLLALITAQVAPTVEVAWVTAFLFLTIYLFVFEVLEVDVAAVTVMVLLGLSSLLAPLMGLQRGLVDTARLFDGFSSNAVISIIAVMVIGAGLDRTGIILETAVDRFVEDLCY